ncbi:MAG: hypothetical protein M1838_004170 [Thelocarpon superellum]|nr:MAG: hypothetical protein M1838_004170 [Thelocarpon superellum]
MATLNPIACAFDQPSAHISRHEYEVGGISLTVHGQDELLPSVGDVVCLWLHHPRLQNQSSMNPLAAHVVTRWNAQTAAHDLGEKGRGLVAVSFDARNHGAREVSPRANQAWREGNDVHAQDMYAIYHGTVVDTSFLMDHLESYIFRTGRRRLVDHLVLGVSLGGHSAWQLVVNEPRISAAVVVVGCCDYTRLMQDRAAKSRLPSWTSTDPPGAAFIGSGDFPPSLMRAVARHDPAGQLTRTTPEDRWAVALEEDEGGVQLMIRRCLGDKRILNLAGGADKLVPYACSAPFLRLLQQSHSRTRAPRELRDRVFEGVGHELTAPMLDEATAFILAAGTAFKVNGTNIPDVDFDIGESYAGLLPVSSSPNETRQLYFWYFPSSNPAATDEITIWLNGGPGCSSLEGLLQENGPFLWQVGTFKPVANPWTWTKLTNMIWVEQPVGTGFSQGTPDATSEADVAAEFLGFWKNFLDTFGLTDRKVYITGESYAGYYVPYIADAMFARGDTKYHDVRGTMIYDPSTSTNDLQEQVPVTAFVEANANLFSLNQSFMTDIQWRANKCGYTKFLDEQLVYPPTGLLPTPPSSKAPGCDIWDDVFAAASLINPCFDVYQIATTCPLLFDPLGFPGSLPYLPDGASIYFDRADVKKAINAPEVKWTECTNTNVFVHGLDKSPPSGLSVLPGVIEKSERTVIGHGLLDMILIANGTLLMIQNMTWHNDQGFSREPASNFYVPYHSAGPLSGLAGAGVFGTTHTERNLTWVAVSLSGHMIPQYAPSASFRMLEYLLGRIDELTSTVPFTA